ncbi:T cell receptor gamma variable 4, partial [Galemys pyrenaicus]
QSVILQLKRENSVSYQAEWVCCCKITCDIVDRTSTTSTGTDTKLERPHTTFSTFHSLAQSFDAGVYYCATWDSHCDSDFFSTENNVACSCQDQPLRVHGTGDLEQPQHSSTKKLSRCVVSAVTVSNTCIFSFTLAPMALVLGCPCPGSPGGACSQLPQEAHSGVSRGRAPPPAPSTISPDHQPGHLLTQSLSYLQPLTAHGSVHGPLSRGVGFDCWSIPFRGQQEAMLWALVLLPIFLTPASQISFNSEGRKMSITKLTGSAIVITCDIVDRTINYIHWYRFQEGEAPHRLLYFVFTTSKPVVESGITSGKYHAYEGSGRTCKFVARHLDQSDAAVYYCAAWDAHSDADFPSTAHRTDTCWHQPGSSCSGSIWPLPIKEVSSSQLVPWGLWILSTGTHRAMLGLLALLGALHLPGCQAAVTLEQPIVVMGRAGGSAVLRCMVRTKVSYIHWYRYLEGKAPERLLRLATFKSDVQWDNVIKADKVTAMESSDGSSCTLSVLRLQKGDEGTPSVALVLSAYNREQFSESAAAVPLYSDRLTSQISFNSKGRTLSVTKQNGSIAEITCDIVDRTINYIHWYRFQVGEAPHRLLYFSFTDLKVVLEAGITSDKFHALEGSGRTCKLFVQNVQQSDAGVYYCAAWDSHGCQAAVKLEQPQVVLGRVGSSAVLPCTVHTKVCYIHWYRHQEGKAPERLLLLATSKSDAQWDSVLNADKVRAMQSSDGSSCSLSVLRLQKGDEGMYYCAAWDPHSPAPRPGRRSKTNGIS